MPPLINVYEKVAELAVVLVYEVNSLWTDSLKGHDNTACNKLQGGGGGGGGGGEGGGGGGGGGGRREDDKWIMEE